MANDDCTVIIPRRTPESAAMSASVKRAMAITARLNRLTFNDADGVRAFCQGQIAHYKIPRYVFFVEEFPMTVTGKIQKFIMREQVMKELNLTPRQTA